MNRLLKLVLDVPVEIALSSTDGINVVSPRGTPAVKYTLVDGRIFFATAYVAAKFQKLNVEACERIVLCMRNIDGKSITIVERAGNLETASQPKSPPRDGTTPKPVVRLDLVMASKDECPAPPFLEASDSHDARFEADNPPGDRASLAPHAGKTRSELMNELSLTRLSLVIANAGNDQNAQHEESADPPCGLEPPPPRNGTSAGESKPERASNLSSDQVQVARPIGQLERALKTAILAAHSAEQYGKEIGYVVRFDQESVKCMAVTVLIGMQGGRY